MRNACGLSATTLASHAVAGLSSVVADDMLIPPLVSKDEVAHAGYGDDLSEDTQMGPA